MKKNLPSVFLALFIAMFWVISCQKDPEPTPNPEPTPDTITSDTVTPVVPADTITPVNPGDTVTPIVPGDTLDPSTYDTIPGRKVWFSIGLWPVNSGHQGIHYPTKDTIEFYANHPGCDTIKLLWAIPPNLTAGWTPDVFRSPRDTLKALFRMSPKIYGEKRFMLIKIMGAQVFHVRIQ